MARKKLKIGILDIVTRNPKPTLYGKVMHGNLASIMPQAVGVWCEEMGHDVRFICYVGGEDLVVDFDDDMDVLFIGAFTESAQMAYALSNLFQKRGVVTVLGGPHARCYPEDALKYFDYVLGFTDRAVIEDLLADPVRAAKGESGAHLSASGQPDALPGVRERWKYVSDTLAKTITNFKISPMIGSLGCPYTCSFCIDSTVKYQPLDYTQIRDDIRFLLTKFKRPVIGWHDPNFGVRFDDYLSTIEEADPERRTRHIAESSLSLMTGEKTKRFAAAGFEAALPGIESWYDMGAKSKTGAKKARDKMIQVSDHVNEIMEHIPYLQANFVLGLDGDEGAEPFELTKEFLARSPGAFPAYSLLSAFGEAAPMNADLQREGRVIPFPFHFLNNNQAMNVRPKNYDWVDFYEKLVDLSKYSFGVKAIARRMPATAGWTPKWMNVVRAVSSEGWGRIKYHSNMVSMLKTDKQLRAFFDGETTVIPQFYIDRMKDDLGFLWDHLPDGAIEHDPNAYMKKEDAKVAAANDRPKRYAPGAEPAATAAIAAAE